MGQKTHPLGFRLGITQEHESQWYADFKQYAKILKKDDQFRQYLYKELKGKFVSNILIKRNGSLKSLEITIKTGKPDEIIGKEGKNYKTLVKNLNTIFGPYNTEKDEILSVQIHELNNQVDAGCLADSIVEKLEARIAFRKVIRQILDSSNKNVLGIKIQVSGRLNGAEMARSEWVRKGRVPLQTLRADIDYATREAHTIYGVLGIKVWVFKGELLNK